MSKTINKIDDVYSNDFYHVDVDPFWNSGDQTELKIHRIHAYPAKFPAFIFDKGVQYAAEKGLYPKLVADIFCGCGTVALEARRNNIEFWGCDINPVATMIAKTKSKIYNTAQLSEIFDTILDNFLSTKMNKNYY